MIGVFDSGSGGLTVLEALHRALPDRDFLYFGDHARAPYGVRDAQEVDAFTREAVVSLINAGCRLIVLACNTAAAVALRPLQQTWLPYNAPDVRVLGVHVPLVEAITRCDWNTSVPIKRAEEKKRTVAVFATPRTVETGSFVTEITSRSPHITVLQQACPGLAGAIEAGASLQEIDSLVAGYVDELMSQEGAQEIDSAALACTHYPFAYDQFRTALPPHVDVLTQPLMVAAALEDYLRRRPECDQPGNGTLTLLTSGDPTRLNGIIKRLPPAFQNFKQINPGLAPV